MLAVVQIIFSTWSKEYRGGPKASERNRVPEAEVVPRPAERIPEPYYLVHTSKRVFGSLPGTNRLPGPSVQVISADEPFYAGSVRIGWEGEQLRVDYHWTWDAGMPERHSRRDVLQIQPGQWGRVRYNARLSICHFPGGGDSDDWWYEKWVFNVGLFSTFREGAFIETEPVKVYSAMDRLW
jgi:hypothetical protein